MALHLYMNVWYIYIYIFRKVRHKLRHRLRKLQNAPVGVTDTNSINRYRDKG